MKPSIIVIDKIEMSVLAAMQAEYGAVYEPTITYEALCGIIAEYDILVISTRMRIDAQLLKHAANLKLIIRMGIGVDHIDLKYCKAHAITVAITPLANVSPVAELVFGQMLRVYRNLDLANENVRAGKFRTDYPHGNELNGKTIAIIGVGRIGSRVATIAKAFGMRTVGYDPLLSDSVRASKDIDLWTGSPTECVKDAHIVTFHVPLTEQTRGLVNSDFLDCLPDDCLLINTSRGNVVNFDELFKYPKIAKFRKIVFDVFDEEPFDPQRLPADIADKFYFTPHGGAWTKESLLHRSEETLLQIRHFERGQTLHGLIDLDRGY